MTCLVTITVAVTTAATTAISYSSIIIGSLMVFLVVQELANDSEGLNLKFLGRYLSLGIIPLLFVFASIIIISVL